MKTKLTQLGNFLGTMVMPNIGAFIAWGLFTALFIDGGWMPNEKLAALVGPTLTCLLPILIASQGGFLTAGERGRILGAIAVMGAICGSEYTMLLGAMVLGPAAGWVIRTFDRAVAGKIPESLTILVNNFSLGILGVAMAALGCWVVGPVMSLVLRLLSAGADALIQRGLLPLLAVFIEPAKVLFLNNAINLGVFAPLGAEQVARAGRSVLYMLESNPGPGLGVLLACWAFSKDKATRQSVPGAVVIHFLGGIHEIYFPYVLMNPPVILGPIAGSAAAIWLYSALDVGLLGPVAPGSVLAFLAMAPQDSLLTVALGVALSAGVSFLISAPLIRPARKRKLSVRFPGFRRLITVANYLKRRRL